MPYLCECGRMYETVQNLLLHQRHECGQFQEQNVPFLVYGAAKTKASAFKGKVVAQVKTLQLRFGESEETPDAAFNKVIAYVKKILAYYAERSGVKVFLAAKALMGKTDADTTSVVTFRSETGQAIPNEIEALVGAMVGQIANQVELYARYGSGHVVQQLYTINIELGLFTQEPLRAGAPTLPLLIDPASVYDFTDLADGECAKYAFLAVLHGKEVKGDPRKRESYARYEKRYKPYPKAPYTRTKIVRMCHRIDRKCAIIRCDAQDVVTVHCDNPLGDTPMVFLEIENHIWGVKEHNALMHAVRKGEHGTRCQSYYCLRCSSAFETRQNLAAHRELCENSLEAPLRLVMPTGEKATLKLPGAQYSKNPDYLVFLDSETLSVKNPDFTGKGTKVTFVPVEYHLILIRTADWKIMDQWTFQPLKPRDNVKTEDDLKEEVGYEMLLQMQKWDEQYCGGPDEPMRSCPEVDEACANARVCDYCGVAFTAQNKPTRNHNHSDPSDMNVVNILCQTCNLAWKAPFKLVAFCANLSFEAGYILMGAAKLNRELVARNLAPYHVSFIGASQEKCKEIKVGRLVRFADLIEFVHIGVDSMVQSLLATERGQGLEPFSLFGICKQILPIECIPLLTAKIPFPYAFMGSIASLNYPGLPPQADFYNHLTETECSDEDYSRAQELYRLAGCRKFGDYCTLYIKSDTAILADYYKNYDEVTAKEHGGLRIGAHISSSQLYFNSARLLAGVEIGLLQDPEIYMQFRQALQGGFCDVLAQKYDAKPGYQFLSADVVSLYPSVQTEYPAFCGNAREVQLTLAQLMELDTEGPTGYYVFADMNVPAEEHDRLSNLPPFLVNMETTDVLSPFQEQRLRETGSVPSKGKKLCGYLGPVTNYGVDLRQFQFMVRVLRVQVTAVRLVVAFDQSFFLKKYIERGLALKAAAPRGSIARDDAKRSVTTLWGKAATDSSKHVTCVLSATPHEFSRHLKSARLKSWNHIGNGAAVIELRKRVFTPREPIILAAVVLSTAKLWNLRHYYTLLYPKILAPLTPLESPSMIYYRDTDSTLMALSPEAMARLLEHKLEFDFSDYDPSHPLYHTEKKGKCGVLADELNGAHVAGGIFLAPKSYVLYDAEGKKIKSAAKGIKKAFMPSESDYALVINHNMIRRKNIAQILSKNQQNVLFYTHKKLLTCDFPETLFH